MLPTQTQVKPKIQKTDPPVVFHSIQDRFYQIRRYFIEKLTVEKHGKSGFQKIQFHQHLEQAKSYDQMERACKMYQENYEKGCCDQDLVKTLGRIDWQKDTVMAWMGDLNVAQGAHLFLMALPFLIFKYPTLKFLVIGRGESREFLEALILNLERAQPDHFFEILKKYFLKLSSKELKQAHHAFLQRIKRKEDALLYFEHARSIEERLFFTGTLSQKDLEGLLPLCQGAILSAAPADQMAATARCVLACGVVPLFHDIKAFSKFRLQVGKKLKSKKLKLKKLRLDLHYIDHFIWNMDFWMAHKARFQKAMAHF
ncbi:MAG: hypothetical protein HY390_04355 [Deltaproteobacteria bacterium]|nr:hypothetical protein [Deltaproteobacteria bacterium]